MKKVRVSRVEEQVCILFILLVEVGDYSFQPNVPDHEKEPIANYQFPFPSQGRLTFQMLWHVSQGPSVRPVLLKVFQKPLILHSVQKVLHVVEDERIQVQVNR